MQADIRYVRYIATRGSIYSKNISVAFDIPSAANAVVPAVVSAVEAAVPTVEAVVVPVAVVSAVEAAVPTVEALADSILRV